MRLRFLTGMMIISKWLACMTFRGKFIVLISQTKVVGSLLVVLMDIVEIIF